MKTTRRGFLGRVAAIVAVAPLVGTRVPESDMPTLFDDIEQAMARYREYPTLANQREAERLMDRATALIWHGDADMPLPPELKSHLPEARTISMMEAARRAATMEQDDTALVQSMIDRAKGGGTVAFEARTYRIGTINVAGHDVPLYGPRTQL